MRFIHDMAGEITDSGYSTAGGKITLKIQYRSRAVGFLVCVSEIFSEPVPKEDPELLERLGRCLEKSGSKEEFTWQEKVYQFFYVTEDKIRTRGCELPLPGSVKSPARIDLFWVDEAKNAHVESEKTGTMVIPISISVRLERRKRGLFSREYFCDIHLNCLAGTDWKEPVLYYRVSRKEVCYPISAQVMKKGSITLKTQEEATDISIEVFPQYKKFYKLQVSS